MGIYQEVYDFAAKAGALEGYVYPKEKVDLSYLPRWVDNLVTQYHRLPPEILRTESSPMDVGSEESNPDHKDDHSDMRIYTQYVGDLKTFQDHNQIIFVTHLR